MNKLQNDNNRNILAKLLFDIDKKNDYQSSPELFHSDLYLRPNHSNYRLCPNCSTEAHTNKEIVDKFGLRNVNGKNILQSWCKECRKSKEYSDSNNNNQENIDIH